MTAAPPRPLVEAELVAECCARVDAANAEDPNLVGNTPRALLEGRMASAWLAHVAPEASTALRVAARAHHLRRWQVERRQYPEGRSGYLRWRRDNKLHQRDQLRHVLDGVGLHPTTIERVGQLLLRTGLGSDPEAQALEDVACLVFVETRFDELLARLGHDTSVGIVRKTLHKMSAEAIQLAGSVRMSDGARSVLADAAGGT